MSETFDNKQLVDEIKANKERFESRFTMSDGCWEWNANKTADGYGVLSIAGKAQYAHRVSYQLYIGEIPSGMCVCHRCDNPRCVNPAHLFLGTKADNNRDCKNKGRGVGVGRGSHGEDNGCSKLNKEQVIEIRALHSKGVTQSELSKEFGVTQAQISNIIRRYQWASL